MAVFIALMLVRLSKCLKQIIEIELNNRVKNPNWPAGYLQAWLRIWTRDYHEQIQLVVRAGLELKASKLQVQLSNHPATLPSSKVTLYYSELSQKTQD